MARTKAASAPPSPITCDVVAAIHKSSDLEVHVCVLEVGGVRGLDIRDFVTKTGKYGRQGILPLDDAEAADRLTQLIEALEKVRSSL